MSPDLLSKIIGSAYGVAKGSGFSDAEAAEYITLQLRQKFNILPKDGYEEPEATPAWQESAGMEVVSTLADGHTWPAVEEATAKVFGEACRMFKKADQGGSLNLDMAVSGSIDGDTCEIEYTFRKGYGTSSQGGNLHKAIMETYRRQLWDEANETKQLSNA